MCLLLLEIMPFLYDLPKIPGSLLTQENIKERLLEKSKKTDFDSITKKLETFKETIIIECNKKIQQNVQNMQIDLDSMLTHVTGQIDLVKKYIVEKQASEE